MTPDTLKRHLAALAKACNVSPEAADKFTTHLAETYVKSARGAESRCPGEADWLGMVLACNVAPNPHARKIIEHKAHTLWKESPCPAT